MVEMGLVRVGGLSCLMLFAFFFGGVWVDLVCSFRFFISGGLSLALLCFLERSTPKGRCKWELQQGPMTKEPRSVPTNIFHQRLSKGTLL